VLEPWDCRPPPAALQRDEPEAALSPQWQLAFSHLFNHGGARSQFLIATHSPIIMTYLQALIYWFTAGGVEPVAYEKTEHYRVTKALVAPREEARGLAERVSREGVRG
jgi:predicted ATPase